MEAGGNLKPVKFGGRQKMKTILPYLMDVGTDLQAKPEIYGRVEVKWSFLNTALDGMKSVNAVFDAPSTDLISPQTNPPI